MNFPAASPSDRATARRIAALAAATAFTLPALLGTAALPSAAATTVAAVDPAPPAPAAPSGPIGGPRMGETGLVFGGGSSAPPQVAASAYVVADAHDGRVLAASNPHGSFRPASTQKTLLALTMLPRLDPNGTYTASQDDANVEGTRVGMYPSQTYKIDDLWYGLLLRSGNDAANGLAKAGADGDLAKGVRMMNEEAKRLQAFDTTAVNPSGLDEDGQFSSAYDLALMGRAGLARNDFSNYVKTIKWTFPGNQTKTATEKTEKDFQVYTENRLLLNNYPGAIGVKMGYTTKAQNTMIAAAERDGQKVVVTLLNVPQGHIRTAAGALLDWGIANAATAVPVGNLVEPTSLALTSVEDGMVSRPDPATTEEKTLSAAGTTAAGSWSSSSSSSSSPSGESSAPLGLSVPSIVGVAAGILLALGVLRVLAVRKARRMKYYMALVAQKQAAQARAAAGGER